jgi:hypothetical protein
MTPAIDKLYIILGNRHEVQAEKLDAFLGRLFPYLNVTSNIYILAPTFSEAMPQAERILKSMKTFLRANRFVRYYLHFLHTVVRGNARELDYYSQYHYQPWRRGITLFDKEAYVHQEIPRMGLLTIVAPSEKDDGPYLESLLDVLKEVCLRPSLYVHGQTSSLAQNEGLVRKAEKVYFGPGPSDTPAQIGCNLRSQDLVETSFVALQSGTFSMTAPCAPSLFVTADDGNLYPCMNALVREEAAASSFENPDTEAMIAHCRNSIEKEQDCRACKERVFGLFGNLPKPWDLQHAVDALLAFAGRIREEGREGGIPANPAS